MISATFTHGRVEKSITLTVTVTVVVDADRITATVRDEGIGIPGADLPHLFEPFQRGHNVGDRPGTGLGLAIARRGIRLHGGDLTVATEEGCGSTFAMVLPRRPGTPPADAGTDQTADAPRAARAS